MTAAAGSFSGVITDTPTQAANTSADGLALADTTAATAGNQQYSPRLRLTGQGWKTNATAASQTLDFITELVPVQGAANPVPTLNTSVQVNGGGYVNFMSLAYGGTANLAAQPADSTQRFMVLQNSTGRALYGVDSGGAVYAWALTGGTLFGTASTNNVDFYANNINALSIINGAALVNEQVYVKATQAATSVSTGGLRVDGGAGVAGAIYGGAEVVTGTTAVGTLPTCNSAHKGARHFVTDANATFTAGIGAVVAAGGANNVPVTCDGTNWRIG